MGLLAFVASPASAQIADRADRRGSASGSVVRTAEQSADCVRFDRYGDHRWDEYGWDGDVREIWWRDGIHRDRRERDRDRARCADWIRRVDSRRSRFAREHDLLHEKLWRDHMQWHRRHGNQPRNRGWQRSHGAMHEKLAREHARWHRRYDHEYGYAAGVNHRYDDRYERDDRYDRSEPNRPGRARGVGRN
jgi:hypothetical protein